MNIPYTLTIPLFFFPAIALVVGYTGQPSVQAEAPVDNPAETRKIYVVQHYKLAEPQIVVTVNNFPFDVGGSRPYEINVQGQRFTFDPEHVKEFLSKGKPMKIFQKPLPSGVVISDGLHKPVYINGDKSSPAEQSVLSMGPPPSPGGRLR
jgi:hypothetical protein